MGAAHFTSMMLPSASAVVHNILHAHPLRTSWRRMWAPFSAQLGWRVGPTGRHEAVGGVGTLGWLALARGRG